MPLTKFQADLALLLSSNRTEDSHLAGGAALHLEAQSLRYSNDLDYFNDSDERVAKAYDDDARLLARNSYSLKIEVRQPGYIRAQVSKNKNTTKIEWAHDSAWRFMPPIKDDRCGFRLHPIDLAINKVLTLAGRHEARDFLDVLEVNDQILSLGALCWAAAGKDPGLNPRSLLELLKRRGRFRNEDFDRLNLTKKVDLQKLKTKWLKILEEAEHFIDQRDPGEMGCLYYSLKEKKFVTPLPRMKKGNDYQLHFGRPGGVLPLLEA